MSISCFLGIINENNICRKKGDGIMKKVVYLMCILICLFVCPLIVFADDDDYEENCSNGHNWIREYVPAGIGYDGYDGDYCDYCSVTNKKTTIYAIKTVKLSKNIYTYNGKIQKPTVVVKDRMGNTISKEMYAVNYAKGLKNVGKYTVRVNFTDLGYYEGDEKLSFTINPKNTSISKLVAGKKKFSIKIKKYTTQTTGYQIQYGVAKNFKGAKILTLLNKTTSKTIKNLKAKKTYYVRLRTYKTVNKTKYYSSWTKTKSVKTK